MRRREEDGMCLCDNKKDLERTDRKRDGKSLILYFLPHGGFLIVLFINEDLFPIHKHSPAFS